MTTIEQEYARLKALADAATPGPWTQDGYAVAKELPEHASDSVICVMQTKRYTNRKNAAFIASAHDMMALIERLMAERRAEGTP